MAIITMSTEKTLLGPHLSSAMPTTIRAGIVSATLHIAKTFICDLVSQSNCANIVVANGAILNHTKNVIKNAIHVRWSALICGSFTLNKIESFIYLSSPFLSFFFIPNLADGNLKPLALPRPGKARGEPRMPKHCRVSSP